MATKTDLKQLYETSMRLIEGDKETDPIKRQFNHHGVHAGSQLRQRYDELLTAQANLEKCQQMNADVSGRMWNAAAQMETIRPRYIDLDAPVLTLEQSREWYDLRGLSDLLNEDLSKLKALESSLQLKVNDCGKAWDQVYTQWKSIMWVETGEAEFQPPFLVADSDGKVWRAPSWAERDGIAATRARIES